MQLVFSKATHISSSLALSLTDSVPHPGCHRDHLHRTPSGKEAVVAVTTDFELAELQEEEL